MFTGDRVTRKVLRNLLSSLASSQNSRVVIVEEPLASSGTSIETNVVQIMVDAGIKTLTQQNDSGIRVASGLYLCRLKAGDFQKSIIMILIK